MLIWPGVTAVRSAGPRRACTCCSGTEPSRAWKSFTTEILEVVEDLGIEAIVFLRCDARGRAALPPDLGLREQRERPGTCSQLALERSIPTKAPSASSSVLGDASSARASRPSPSGPRSPTTSQRSVAEGHACHRRADRGDRRRRRSLAATWSPSPLHGRAGSTRSLETTTEHGVVHRAARAGARHRGLPEASGEAIAQEFERYLRRVWRQRHRFGRRGALARPEPSWPAVEQARESGLTQKFSRGRRADSSGFPAKVAGFLMLCGEPAARRYGSLRLVPPAGLLQEVRSHRLDAVTGEVDVGQRIQRRLRPLHTSEGDHPVQRDDRARVRRISRS